jgi:hypothetical protein
MAYLKLLEEISRFHRDDRGASGGGVPLGVAWAVLMCLGVIALLLAGCADPDPFKGF